MKSVQEEPTNKRCLLSLDLKPSRSHVKEKNSIDHFCRDFQSITGGGKKLLAQTSL